jgi:tryptophan-rich sensory protein
MIIRSKILPTIILVLGAAIISYLFMDVNSDWYQKLLKPKINPPNWIFRVVWPILYFLLILSYILLPKNTVLTLLFSTIVILLALWSPIFFGFRSPFLGSLVLILLSITSIIYLFYSYKYSNISSILFMPLLLWILFATYLNISISIIN